MKLKIKDAELLQNLDGSEKLPTGGRGDFSTSVRTIAEFTATEYVTPFLDGKVDKEVGKGLSTNDYTDLDVFKLNSVQEGAEKNINADWDATTGDAEILNKPDFDALATQVAGKQDQIVGTGNATDYYGGDKLFHELTADTVGLGNVDNTSDADKPVSSAVTAALLEETTEREAEDTSIRQAIVDGDSITLSDSKAYADGLVVGMLKDRGGYDPTATSAYPTTGGSGTAGAIKRGDIYTLTASGNLGGIAVDQGDTVRALSNDPGQTASNWLILEHNLGYAPEPSITPGTIAQYIRGDKSLSDFKADVLATALSGLVFTTNAAITATDSILAAFGKLQAQVDKRLRFDASQTLTAAEQTQAKSNLGVSPDLLLTAKQITGTATATNVPSLVLTPDATVFTGAATHVVLASKFDTANRRGGSLSLQQPDSATTGGNQRGIGSIDMQVSRTAATQVTGDYSIALGQNQAVTGCSIGISRSYGQTVNNAGIVLNNFNGTFAAGAVTQGIALNCQGTVNNGISLGNSSNVLNGIGIQIPALDPGYANVSRGIGIGSYVTATNYAFAIGLIATATDGSFCMSADSSTSIQAMNGSFAMGSGGLTNGKYALSMGRNNLNSGYCNGVFGEGITTGNYHNGVYTGGNGAVTKINALSAQIAANSTAVLKFGNGSVQTGYLQEMQSGYDAFIGYVYLEARVGTNSPTAAAYYKIEAAKHNVGAGGLLGTPVITTLGTTDNTVTSLWTLTVTFVGGILRITAGLNNAAGSAKMQVQALG